MKFRPNQQIDRKIQENFLTKKLFEMSNTIKQNIQTQNQSNLAEKDLNNNMQSSTLITNCVCGLNNLGNTCFFNSVLQNLAQTPFLDELLSENVKSSDTKFIVKHNEEYDSELTDYDEESDQLNNNKAKINETSDDSDDTQSKDSVKTHHRSIPLKELNLVLRESPGLLTRHFHEIIFKMNSSSSSQAPNALFSSLCKRVPSFKGFQQQDSHELLRNLLDAVKTEEIKRRQSAILELFKINKSAGTDDLTKKKIKRYGRLASHTLIDRLFGGHLLSSIVCEVCKNCTQRVEPFLDLSLPIVDNNAKSNNVPDYPTNFKNKSSTKYNRKTLEKDLKKDNSTEDLIDKNDQKNLSKHQLKKQKLKKGSKKLKKKNRTDSISTPNNEDESTPKTESLINNIEVVEVVETEDQSKDEDKVEPDLAESINNLSLNLNSTITENTQDLKTDEPCSEHEEDNSSDKEEEEEEEDNNTKQSKSYKLENNFRLESMKSVSQLTELDPCSLESCLAKFTSKEILGDKINCENCSLQSSSHRHNKVSKVYTMAQKQYLICELPAVLTIHLKRFQQYGYRLEKSNKFVSFPLILDMSPYTSKMCINKSENHKILYSLYGLVEHSGRLNSGHYTAYVKPGFKDMSSSHVNITNQKRFLSNQRLCHLKQMLKNWKNVKTTGEEQNHENNAVESDKWYYISDSHVSEVNVAKVLKSQAYMLFYERIQ